MSQKKKKLISHPEEAKNYYQKRGIALAILYFNFNSYFWTWATSDIPPNMQELDSHLERLEQSAIENGNVSSGRVTIEYMENEFFYYLDLV